MTRRPTSTSAFGVSKRESHDASGFYQRFTPPELSEGSEVAAWRALDKLIAGDARLMDEVPDASVALVVTSPPYFAGKEYEQSLGEGGVPGTYLQYLDLLREVFAQCVRKLEPGGRLAVNVANLGRRPYRSLSADVTAILQDDLRLLLRGEVIWLKQRGASGSCAWGSFQSPANPVLRDLTERVVVASKGRFDRAVPRKLRAQRGLPHEASMTREDFMEDTLDVWEIPAESATRVGHPAPFPVELPARLIDLYTYRGDLVLDPFVGSGTTAVAALRAGRHYVGYDLDEGYIRLAESRVESERSALGEGHANALGGGHAGAAREAPVGERPQADAVREGWAAADLARALIEAAGFTAIERARPGLARADFEARDSEGGLWLFGVAGSFTTYRPGLRRADALWKAIGKAAVLHETAGAPLVLLTPGAGAGAEVLGPVTGPGKPVHSVIDMLDDGALGRLRRLCEGEERSGGAGGRVVSPTRRGPAVAR